MNEPRPERPLLTPVADLLGEALRLYARHAPVLAGAAIAGALAGNLVGLLVTPSSFAGAVVWSLYIAALTTGFQAPVWLFAVFMHGREPLPETSVMYGLFALGPKFFTLGLIFGAAAGVLVLTAVQAQALFLPVFVVMIYCGVRFSLAGPAMILGRTNPLQGLRRSWQLVEGRWWRTFAIHIPIVLLTLVLSIIAARAAEEAGGSAVATALISAVALGVSVPLVALVEMALYSEYSFVVPPAVRKEGEE